MMEMKSTLGYPAIEHDKKERVHYICCTTNRCSIVLLVFLYPHLVSVLFAGPSLHDFNFYKKFFTLSAISDVNNNNIIYMVVLSM